MNRKKQSKGKRIQRAALVSLLAAAPAFATVTFTWTGGGNTADWAITAVPNNWGTTGAPWYPGQDGQSPADHVALINFVNVRDVVFANLSVTFGHMLLGDGHTLEMDADVSMDDYGGDEDGGLQVQGDVIIKEAGAGGIVTCDYISINFDQQTDLVLEKTDGDEYVVSLETSG